MDGWTINFTIQAGKEFAKLDKLSQYEILKYLNNKILKLPNPKFLGKSLSGGKKGLWRYRVNKFRIICKLEEDNLIILIIKIGKRDVVYNS